MAFFGIPIESYFIIIHSRLEKKASLFLDNIYKFRSEWGVRYFIKEIFFSSSKGKVKKPDRDGQDLVNIDDMAGKFTMAVLGIFCPKSIRDKSQSKVITS